jgi:hypothetical protein
MAAVLRRTPPAPAVEAPRRMMRVSRPGLVDAKSVAAQEKIESTLKNHLQLIAYNANRAEYLRASIAAELLSLEEDTKRHAAICEKALKDGKLKGWTTADWECKFEDTLIRGSREPKLDEVLLALGEENFLKVVKVQITELKEFMTDNEINAVSTVVPATPGPTVFKHGPVGVKKGKK